ncbi:hypothetical protein [Dyadobacter bucti]|uniref:hypothetical protein n=1 Tax=Dyadobacter bucti TaxID=2572203 RepID=UPI0011094E0F|nr:hypothetical protein [Dyadobacter bucti]
MKNKLHQSLTIVMALLVLLSSTGFAFIEHQCMMRGKSVQLVSEKKSGSCETKVVSSCCAKSKALKESTGVFFKKTDCCKENQKFEKLDVLSSLTQHLAKASKAISDDMLWSVRSFSFIQAEWILPSSERSDVIISFSSLFHGRSMLFFVQSFLI